MVISSLYKKDEQGSVLIVALLILVLLTVIGISATTTTDIETQIAGNQKFHKIAFYNADSGIFPTAKVVSTIMDNQTEPDLGDISYIDNNGDTLDAGDGTLLREIMGYDAYEGKPDIKFPLDSFEVNVDINRTGVRNIAGGGVEFAAGAEGIGTGSSGGVAVYYNLDSTGEGPAKSQSNIAADYRKVVGVPGGL